MSVASTSSFDSSRIEFHRSNQDVSLQSYVDDKRRQLGAMVTSTQRIYLDQRFWLLLRDVLLDRSGDAAISDLLALLRYLVSQGKVICPISESVFIELLKQSDKSTRLATAQLIDDLSLGITLIPLHERIQQELCNSFYEQAGVNNLIPLQQLVWTKLPYVLGEIHPYNTPFPPKEELVLQKSFLDHIWNTSLVEMIRRSNEPPPQFDWNALAARLNLENRAHHSTIRSYSQAFRAEFEGGLSLFRTDIAILVKELEERGYSDFASNLSHLSLNKRFEIFSQSIPSLHINGTCHAAVRWDQKRNLCGNDLFDFHHAEAALGYCDVFLTEKPLTDMLSQKHLGLSKYKCRTFWSPASALNWLRGNGN